MEALADGWVLGADGPVAAMASMGPAAGGLAVAMASMGPAADDLVAATASMGPAADGLVAAMASMGPAADGLVAAMASTGPAADGLAAGAASTGPAADGLAAGAASTGPAADGLAAEAASTDPAADGLAAEAASTDPAADGLVAGAASTDPAADGLAAEAACFPVACGLIPFDLPLTYYLLPMEAPNPFFFPVPSLFHLLFRPNYLLHHFSDPVENVFFLTGHMETSELFFQDDTSFPELPDFLQLPLLIPRLPSFLLLQYCLFSLLYYLQSLPHCRLRLLHWKFLLSVVFRPLPLCSKSFSLSLCLL